MHILIMCVPIMHVLIIHALIMHVYPVCPDGNIYNFYYNKKGHAVLVLLVLIMHVLSMCVIIIYGLISCVLIRLF